MKSKPSQTNFSPKSKSAAHGLLEYQMAHRIDWIICKSSQSQGGIYTLIWFYVNKHLLQHFKWWGKTPAIRAFVGMKQTLQSVSEIARWGQIWASQFKSAFCPYSVSCFSDCRLSVSFPQSLSLCSPSIFCFLLLSFLYTEDIYWRRQKQDGRHIFKRRQLFWQEKCEAKMYLCWQTVVTD